MLPLFGYKVGDPCDGQVFRAFSSLRLGRQYLRGRFSFLAACKYVLSEKEFSLRFKTSTLTLVRLKLSEITYQTSMHSRFEVSLVKSAHRLVLNIGLWLANYGSRPLSLILSLGVSAHRENEIYRATTWVVLTYKWGCTGGPGPHILQHWGANGFVVAWRGLRGG
jgi:hypothetical protein